MPHSAQYLSCTAVILAVRCPAFVVRHFFRRAARKVHRPPCGPASAIGCRRALSERTGPGGWHTSAPRHRGASGRPRRSARRTGRRSRVKRPSAHKQGQSALHGRALRRYD